MGLDYGNLFSEWEMAIARRTAAHFQAKYPWLRGYEFDDLLQICLVHWHTARSRYRPEKGASPQTYMSQVLRRRLQTLLRKELADSRRAHQLAQSLDEIVGDRGITPGDLIGAETEAQADLRLALESVFRILTPLQQRIWHLLRQGYRAAEIARVVRRPRRTVRDEITKIGHILSQRGLNKNR